jgi:lysophospholipase L1-like esterase
MLFAILLAAGCFAHRQERTTPSSVSQNPSLPGTQLAGSRRIVFLGDSITYSGQYVDDTEMALRTLYPEGSFEFLDLGLPSETVSGLSEPGHAGGAFPRPDLHDRLARLLELTHPDLVIACYGMNDGIYYPFGEERFEKYQQGIRLLRERVIKSGAKLILLTPPVFDPQPIRAHTLPAGLAEYRQPYEGYNDVLDRYSDWLLAQRKYGWLVIDVHTPMKKHLAEYRHKDPTYILATDGVHINDSGHALMAQSLLQGLRVPGDGKQLSNLLSTEPGREILKLIHSRNRLLSDAWLTAVGHKRPGMTKGLPLEEATTQATELNHQIKEKLEFSKP